MVAVAFVVCDVLLVLTGGALDMNTMVYLLILPYALFRWGSGRELVIGSMVVLANVILSTVVGYPGLGNAIAGFVVVFAVVTLGSAFRYRAKARLREFDQVKLLERESLARDLHDTVAHHVSAMAVRAQAGLATAESNPNAAAEALQVIEAEASRALTEMRAMVRVLRRNAPAGRSPGRRVSDLTALAGRPRTGPAVQVEIVGAADDLSSPMGTAVYRLAQESVTNARRHARHATLIDVRVSVDDASVHLCVSDDGDTSVMRPAGAHGYGIVGMIERASLLGGTCVAGPGPGGGWTVTAKLPRGGSAG
jgi:signal transduction histidine kinase